MATGTIATRRRPGPAARLLLFAIGAYQLVRSGRPSPCRFQPTCSAYGQEAVEAYGALHGSWLILRRLARCHPWGGMGYDPIPDHH